MSRRIYDDTAKEIAALVGKTIVAIDKNGDEELSLKFSDGSSIRFYHEPDCCESVRIESIDAPLDLLIGSPLIQAEEVTSNDNPPPNCESFTWTFYKFATAKGHVVIRWFGESNGYYSESVTIETTP